MYLVMVILPLDVVTVHGYNTALGVALYLRLCHPGY